ARVNVSPYCVIDCFQEIVPLYVPRLYQSNIVEVSFQITQKDERKFEQWLDLNFQLDPLTRKIGSHPMLAYSYSLRLSLYGSTLLRQRPQKKQNTIELTTVCGQYIFDEIPSDKSRLSGICAISQNGNDITIEMFFMTLKEQINNKISQCIADPWMDTPVFFQLIGNSFIECLSKMATFSEDEQNKLREIQEYSSRVMAEVQQDLETNNPMVSSDELRQVQRSILATLHQLLNFLDFISVSGEVDENLLRAYLFTVKRHLVVICDNGDNPYSVSNEFPSIESQEWEKFFIVRRKNEGNDGIYFSELKLREFLTVEQYSPSAPEPNCK
ncbi:MAG: hypothetical protein JSS53_06040, partial [Proteobacteria bacterium]|nr:hypothetical protein [Pseudomonadota bacterium]